MRCCGVRAGRSSGERASKSRLRELRLGADDVGAVPGRSNRDDSNEEILFARVVFDHDALVVDALDARLIARVFGGIAATGTVRALHLEREVGRYQERRDAEAVLEMDVCVGGE